jgi:hypothetical protein
MTAVGGRPLRSPDELREKGCSEQAVALITALHELLGRRFGRSGQYQALAAASGVPPDRWRRYSKNLSERMGGRRATNGPTWDIVATIIEHCVPPEGREAEARRLAVLWELAWGTPPSATGGRGAGPPPPGRTQHAGLLGPWRASYPGWDTCAELRGAHYEDFCRN